MAITGSVKTLYEDKEKTEAIFPRTKMSAVSDENNKGLDAVINEMSVDVANALNIFINSSDEDDINAKLEDILGV